MSGQLDFEQSPVYLSSLDDIIYTTDTEDYGGSPTDVVTTAKNLTTGETVTSYIINGSPTVSGDIITWPSIEDCVPNQMYGVFQKFTCSSNIYQRRLVIKVPF